MTEKEKNQKIHLFESNQKKINDFDRGRYRHHPVESAGGERPDRGRF